MILYRFAPEQFIANLDGEGARKFGGRWNSKGFPIVYTSLSISLSLIELLVHSAGYEEIKRNRLAIIELPFEVNSEIKSSALKANWQQDEKYSRFMGDSFVASDAGLLLKVPSSVIPDEYNVLINPKHKDMKAVKIKDILTFNFDLRLFKN